MQSDFISNLALIVVIPGDGSENVQESRNIVIQHQGGALRHIVICITALCASSCISIFHSNNLREAGMHGL